jgi:hypothetical protein
MSMKRLLIVLSVLALGACSLEKQGVPEFVGPSTLGLQLDVKASPDVLTRDGVSQSTIEVTATDGATGQPVADLTVQVTASLNLGTIVTPSIRTNGSGKASTVYVAPGMGGTTTATITVTPNTTNFQNTVPRTITIRLFQPTS